MDKNQKKEGVILAHCKTEAITKKIFEDICEECLEIINNERYDYDFNEDEDGFYRNDLQEEELRILDFCYIEIENIMMKVDSSAISDEKLNSIRRTFPYYMVKTLWDMNKEYNEAVKDITHQCKPEGGLTDEAFKTRLVRGRYDDLIYGIATAFCDYEWHDSYSDQKNNYKIWESIADDLNGISKEDIDVFNEFIKEECFNWKEHLNIPNDYRDLS